MPNVQAHANAQSSPNALPGQDGARIRPVWWIAAALLSLLLWYGIYALVS